MNNLSNFPKIGEVVLDPSEKFKDANGNDVYDGLLAGGSEISLLAYPKLHADYLGGRTAIYRRGYIAQCIVSSTVAKDPTNISAPDYADTYADTYAEGIGTHLYRQGGAEVLSLDTTLDYSLFSGDMRVQAYADQDIVQTSSVDFDVVYRTSGGAILLVLQFYRFGNVQVGLRTSTDGVTFIDRPRGGTGITAVNGTFVVGEETLSYTAQGTVNTDLLPFVISVNLSSCATVQVVGLCRHGGTADWSGIWMSFNNSVFVPDMTSPDPTCPYRVVAEKHTPAIGDVRASKLEKYSENGAALFDQLLCDGGEVLESEHPEYFAKLGGISLPQEMIDSSDPFGDGSLVAKYQLEGNAQDITNNYHGVSTNVTYEDSKFGQGASILHLDSRISVASASNVLTGARTVSAFIKLNSSGDYYTVICDSSVYLTKDVNVSGMTMVIPPQGTLIFLVKEIGTKVPLFSIESDAPLPLNKWVHVVATWDATTNANGAKLYVNLVAKSATATGLQTSTPTGNELVIGSNALEHVHEKNYMLDGLIDQVEIYNRALTVDEVTALHAKSAYKPDHTPLDPNFPKRAVADLTGE